MMIGPFAEVMVLASDVMLELYRVADGLRDALCEIPPVSMPKSYFGIEVDEFESHTCFDLHNRWDMFVAGQIDRLIDHYTDVASYQFMGTQDAGECFLRMKEAYGDRITVQVDGKPLGKKLPTIAGGSKDQEVVAGGLDLRRGQQLRNWLSRPDVNAALQVAEINELITIIRDWVKLERELVKASQYFFSWNDHLAKLEAMLVTPLAGATRGVVHQLLPREFAQITGPLHEEFEQLWAAARKDTKAGFQIPWGSSWRFDEETGKVVYTFRKRKKLVGLSYRDISRTWASKLYAYNTPTEGEAWHEVPEEVKTKLRETMVRNMQTAALLRILRRGYTRKGAKLYHNIQAVRQAIRDRLELNLEKLYLDRHNLIQRGFRWETVNPTVDTYLQALLDRPPSNETSRIKTAIWKLNERWKTGDLHAGIVISDAKPLMPDLEFNPGELVI